MPYKCKTCGREFKSLEEAVAYRSRHCSYCAYSNYCPCKGDPYRNLEYIPSEESIW